jgi:hypothetical protein
VPSPNSLAEIAAIVGQSLKLLDEAPIVVALPRTVKVSPFDTIR